MNALIFPFIDIVLRLFCQIFFVDNLFKVKNAQIYICLLFYVYSLQIRFSSHHKVIQFQKD